MHVFVALQPGVDLFGDGVLQFALAFLKPGSAGVRTQGVYVLEERLGRQEVLRVEEGLRLAQVGQVVRGVLADGLVSFGDRLGVQALFEVDVGKGAEGF